MRFGIFVIWYIAVGAAIFGFSDIVFKTHQAKWMAVSVLCAFFWPVALPVCGIVFMLWWMESLTKRRS